MSRDPFDCHHYCGYTTVCNLKGGECNKACHDFITENEWLERRSESGLRVSVAKLKEVLIRLSERDIITNTQAIMIINQIKKEI